MKDVLRPSDVAALLGLTTGRVYQLIRAGTIPAVRMGGAWKIPRPAWDAWLAEETSRAMRGLRPLQEAGRQA